MSFGIVAANISTDIMSKGFRVKWSPCCCAARRFCVVLQESTLLSTALLDFATTFLSIHLLSIDTNGTAHESL